jgi:hypothetical protein
MKKTTLTIDVSKLDKTRFRTYEKRDGTKVVEASVDFIETDTHQVKINKEGQPIEGDTWRLEKVGFVVETPTKEERTNKVNTQIVGNAERFVDKEPANQATLPTEAVPVPYPTDDISPSDIPF